MTEIYDKVVGVRFTPENKAYFFDANGFDLDLDDYVNPSNMICSAISRR